MDTIYNLNLNFIKAAEPKPADFPVDGAGANVATGDFLGLLLMLLCMLALITAFTLVYRKLFKKNAKTFPKTEVVYTDDVISKISKNIIIKKAIFIACSALIVVFVSLVILYSQANAANKNVVLIGPDNIYAEVHDDGAIKIEKFGLQSPSENTCINGFCLEECAETNDASWTITFKTDKTNTYVCHADGKMLDTLLYVDRGQKIDIEISVDMDKDTAVSLIGKKVINFKFRGTESRERYKGTFASKNGALSVTDALGRKATLDNISHPLNNKDVGLFYFLWEGQHGTDGPYDNDKIYKSDPSSVDSEANWIKAGGGVQQAHHFWGEPLYGYYTTDDEWIFRKHVQMLTDAGIDYLLFDTTNTVTYDNQFKKMLKVWYEYFTQGYKVPKFAFYTNTESENTMKKLYETWYKPGSAIHTEYPRIDELWYRIDGKPLIVGKFDAEKSQSLAVSTISEEDKQKAIENVKDSNNTVSRQELIDFFTIKWSQWPNEDKKDNNSWPWIEFDRYMTPDSLYYDQSGKPMVTNVSVAQHSKTVCFSATAWYGENDRTRSYHDGHNDPGENAYFYGYNINQQWDYVLKNFPQVPNVFVTGWNEWVAQRQSDAIQPKWPIYFVDCADPNNSRDIEPMAGPCGDNYYMQLIEKMRLFKGVDARVDVGDKLDIDVNGSFDQWNNEKITAKYTDYVDDTNARDAKGFGNIDYKDSTGRNDFTEMKVAHNKDSLYFYVKCKEDIKGQENDNRTVLFLKTADDIANWNGYTYAINLAGPGKLSKCLGGWNWEVVDNFDYKIEANQIMIKAPYEKLGLSNFYDGLINIEFKWADNFQKDDQGKVDIMSFYKNGDVAPFGRLNFVYSDVVKP